MFLNYPMLILGVRNIGCFGSCVVKFISLFLDAMWFVFVLCRLGDDVINVHVATATAPEPTS